MSNEQSNILKRHEQLTQWFQSDTDKASNLIKEADKIKFTKEVQFLSACNNNDWEEIQRLLSEGIDINSTQDDGLTSLHQACIDDDEHLVKYLVEHGADIDAQDKEGWTPLFAAVSCNYLPITKYLVSRGARLDMVSFDGELPLDQTNNGTMASYIREEMVKQNLDPDEIRNRERTIMLSDIEAMKTTKDFSKFTLVDNGGSLLHIAACKDYMDVLEKLIEIITPEMINHTDNDGWNALHVAAHWGNRRASVMLVNADIDFDKVTFSNQTVLEVSDDDVKPYIREEIRKARFRRQERASVKRPAETPNQEYQPSDTKIICQEKKLPSTVDNHEQEPQPQQKSNGDKHVMPTELPVIESLSDFHKSISNPGGSLDTISSSDVDLKQNTDEMSQREVDTVKDKPPSVSIITAPEPNPTPPVGKNSKPPTEVLQPSNDSKSSKVVVPVLTPSKAAESESQRKDKARHVRSIRRSTQGVTADDIDEAKKMISLDHNNTSDPSPKIVGSNVQPSEPVSPLNHQEADKSDTKSQEKFLDKVDHKSEVIAVEISESNKKTDHAPEVQPVKSINGDDQTSNVSSNTLELPETSISVPDSEPSEQVDKKGKTGGHVVNKRRTRERPPTGIVDPKDVQAALAATEPNKLPDVKTQREPDIDYKALYENELRENEKLNRNLSRLRRDLEQSEDTIKGLQNNHVGSKIQPSPIMSPVKDMKEIEKLRDDNKKMKEANSALIRVISRLSHPPLKSVTGSN